MKQAKHWMIGLAAFAMAAAAATAGDWYQVAELAAGTGPKEVTANFQNARTVQIECVEGRVAINGVLARSGGQTAEHLVERTLEKDQTHEIDLGGQTVSGFRIFDGGTGRYRVNVYVEGDDSNSHTHHYHLHVHPDPHRLPPAAEPGVAPGKAVPVKGPAAKDAPKKDAPKKPAPKKTPPKAPARPAAPKGRP